MLDCHAVVCIGHLLWASCLAVLRCAVLRCAALCCAALCCAVLCCAALCCAVLCSADTLTCLSACLQALLKKFLVAYWRTPEYNYIRFIVTVILGFVLGTLYWKIGHKR